MSSLSMYEVSVPVFARGLDQLSHLLSKGAAHAKEAGIDPATLIQARLAPDMFVLAAQVQRSSDAAKASIARIAGVEAPAMPDTETTFEELIARCAKTRDFVHSVPRDRFDEAAERAVEMKVRGHLLHFTGSSYLLRFGIPNFFFHVTTAYDILRHKGVPIGKLDYLGRFDATPG
jgi:hypothetical protein